jgi:DNA-binding transcriptional MerR regulator
MSTTAQSSGRHLSIGEVLAQLRNDFPDITISKIRFLESQGLIDPERTPSGYRKFYAPDLERLRWILLQQRDHFLPLRIIKARLDAYGPTGAPQSETRESGPGNGQPASVSAASSRAESDVPQTQATSTSALPRPKLAAQAPAIRSASSGPASPLRALAPRDTEADEPRKPPAERRDEPKTATSAPRPSSPPTPPKPRTPPPAPPRPTAPPAVEKKEVPFDDFVDDDEEASEGVGPLDTSDAVPSSTGMTRAELLEATGLSDVQLDALHEFGIITPMVGEGERALYDDEALTIAELCAGYHKRGIEARHLKMYQHFSEREANLFAQVLMRYVQQRNPNSRALLQEELEELARLGRRLRTAMLRRALGKSLTE